MLNGPKRTLTLRRRNRLEEHDSGMQGFHPSAADTLAKLHQRCFWPGMEHGAQAWVQSCHTCRISKPAKRLSPEDRHERYGIPIKVLFIDAIGPVYPSPGGYCFIFSL